MKRCSICRSERPLSDFHLLKTGQFGRHSQCKVCRADEQRKTRERVAKSPAMRQCACCGVEKFRGDFATNRKHHWSTWCKQCESSLADRGLKRCGSCCESKPFSDFHVRKASWDGLAFKCAECVRRASREWRERNPGAFKAWYLDNREERVEYSRQWSAENPELKARLYLEWYKKNPDKVNALIAKRAAAKKRALPAWANLEAIEAIYAEAARLTKETGIRHEVDHIYPLQGKWACGLHCEANLQILTKVENIRKSNRMPDEVKQQRSSSSGAIDRVRRYRGDREGDRAGIS
jgi:hypothetical protein